MLPITVKFWREIILVLLGITLFSMWSIYSNMVENRDVTIAKKEAEIQLNELQKEALRKAILDQNEAVESQRIDAEQRALKFEQSSKEIWKRYEATRKEVSKLTGNEECIVMREMIKGAVK